MPEQVRLWQVETGEVLTEIQRVSLDLESRLQDWLAKDISILDAGLLVKGREVETDFGGYIDLLCIDINGNLAIVELKRDKTPRQITAQVLDYASWIADLSNDRITSIANAYLSNKGFEDSFRCRFGEDVPETLNSEHRMIVVGSMIDASSERIIRYLSDTHGVNINAATFQFYRATKGHEFLARIFLLEQSEVDLHSRSKGTSKRRPNLTYDELMQLAEQSGVKDLYAYAVAAFEQYLQKHTKR